MGLRMQIVGVLRQVERGAWIRFFVAIFGLTLAFAAALLSTASREAGDVLATTVFASSSLLLAGVVAVTTVPYLTRRVVARRVRDAFNYDVTREGLAYLALTLLIGIAALNTGNNLLFIVVAAMLGAVLVSGVVSALMINGLDVELHLPHHVFAGQSYAGAVLLHNRRPLPVFSVAVVPPAEKKERGRWQWRRTMFVYPKPSTGRKPLFRWPDLEFARIAVPRTAPPVFDESVYFPFLPARQRQTVELNLCFPRRGLYAQRGVGISTRFPFSFLIKTRTVSLEREVLVFPSVEPADEMLQVLPMIAGEMESQLRGRGADLYRIRDYAPEDSVRHVDWKATAKSGELKVREFTREDERRVAIVFDNPAPGTLDDVRYEKAVNLAASVAWQFFQENAEVSFAAPDFHGEPDIYSFLEYLAKVAPRQDGDFLGQLGDSGAYRIIVTARRRGEIPSALWQSSYVFFAGE
ncbi:MAG: DUF58 domain-containing protein [Acidobacteriota bacterium]|nr:DUF58 domain-containing protein [Acidobacteriota bacterium]